MAEGQNGAPYANVHIRSQVRPVRAVWSNHPYAWGTSTSD